MLTLTFLEIVLGIDNIIFISIVTDKVPKEKQALGRNLGLGLALVFRIGLLLGITWIIGFTQPILTIFEHDLSGRDLILLAGGLFLLGKSTSEIHHKLEGETEDREPGQKAGLTMGSALVQIIALDMVFSFDSILTAIGLTEHVIIMIGAVVISMIVMMLFSGVISRFINERPTLQILALAFLILIGFMLMIEALGFHVPKGYIYFAVAFSLIVEMINMRLRKNREPVKLNKHMTPDENN